MESLIEVQRNNHEERERCIDMMVRESIAEKRSVFFKHFYNYLKNYLILAERKNQFRS